MKPKALIFGAGAIGRTLFPAISKEYHVVGFLDNNPLLVSTSGMNLPVYEPAAGLKQNHDFVIIASLSGVTPITEQLLNLGVEHGRIITKFVTVSVESRISFLERLAELFHENNIPGNVAEGGVFQGHFSKEINRVFPDKKLYLFDTFTGFDERDVNLDFSKNYSSLGAGHLNITNEDAVMAVMPYPDYCIVRKGYFPETTAGLEDETFCFVNLDFDLYKPILAGLEYFAPRMVSGGIILIHDYFSTEFLGVKEALADFFAENDNRPIFPIGDGISIGIIF
ncbi:MAG: class I SAM-dependent methyltransferase [Turicibacter sp.]|nr:class I SAM-dependent methyltransferase [Turicibacter sp.]